MFTAGDRSTRMNSNNKTLYLLHCFNFELMKHFNPLDLYIRYNLLKWGKLKKKKKKGDRHIFN